MARSPSFERYAYPLLNFNQGIPALSWVVIAIIWFRGIEFRIFFIMVMTTLPAFTFQVLDAYRGMSKDLFEMTLSFRPTRRDLFRTLIWPTVLPGILTAWKVNLGNAARVVVVAELVGATGGVGYELLQQQQIVRHGGRGGLDAGAGDFRSGRAGRDHADRGACAALPGCCGACAVSAAPEIEFEHVGKTFRAPQRRCAVRRDPRSELHASRRGELVAILGKTGCGKSTTFDLISGLLRPSRGRVSVQGHDPSREFNWFRGKIGIVFQNDRLMPWRTALDNVALGSGAQQSAGARAARHRRVLARPPRPCRPRNTTIRMRCRAACVSASRSRAPLPASRASCCATSRSARSTSTPAMRCARSFATCCARPAPPRSSSPIRSRRPCSSASG